MENYTSNKQQRTVMGRFGRYIIEGYDGPDGTPWVAIAMIDENGAAVPRCYLPVEDFEVVSRALTGAECELPDEKHARRRRPLPKVIEFLRDRNAGKVWGTGEEALLAHFFREGLSPAEITLLLGRSRGSITARLMQMGFDPEWAVPHHANLLSAAD